MKRRGRFVFLRWFKCPVCGLVLSAPKHAGDAPGHIKDMWCPTCKAEQKFEQTDTQKIRR